MVNLFKEILSEVNKMKISKSEILSLKKNLHIDIAKVKKWFQLDSRLVVTVTFPILLQHELN
jgi:hypothetical protein